MVLPDTTVVSYGHDDDGLLAAVSHAGGSVAYGHDSFGRLTTETLPGGVTRAHTWTGGRRSSYRETRTGGAKHYGLAYDGAGRLAQVVLSGGTCAARHFDSTYDAAGQLVEWDHNGTVHAYGYDEVGNRTSVVSDAVFRTATFDAADQVVASSQGTVGPAGPVGVETFTYSHDGAGRLYAINRTGLPTGEFFDYDVRGRLLVHRGHWGPTQQWTTSRTYDGADRLVRTNTTTPTAGGIAGMSLAATWSWDVTGGVAQPVEAVQGPTATSFIDGLGRGLAVTATGTQTLAVDNFGSVIAAPDAPRLGASRTL